MEDDRVDVERVAIDDLLGAELRLIVEARSKQKPPGFDVRAAFRWVDIDGVGVRAVRILGFPGRDVRVPEPAIQIRIVRRFFDCVSVLEHRGVGSTRGQIRIAAIRVLSGS